MYLLISAVRQYSIAERNVREGKWKSGLAPSHDPSAFTLGILGLGGIGLRLAHLAHGFPMRVIYHSRNPNPNAPEWAEYFPDREAMLRETNVLSIHVPLKKETEGLVGEKEIRTLRPGSVIINTARGKVIDEDALIGALKDGHVRTHPTLPSSVPYSFLTSIHL